MAVTSTITSISYSASGSQTSFPVPFYFISQQDLTVTGVLNGVTYTYTLNNDYSVVGTPNLFGDYNNGANINFNITGNNSPPATGTIVTIFRNTPETQTIILIDNAAYTADTFNHVFDKLTLMIQELNHSLDQVVTGTLNPIQIYSVSNTFTVPATPLSLILAIETGINYAINLPAATGTLRQVTIKKMSAAGGMIQIVAKNPDKIDNLSLLPLGTQYESYTLIDVYAGQWVLV